MLSKSQAKLFFIAGTLLFTVLLLILTVDTLRQIPTQTREANLSEEVKRGKLLWEKNNCMGCHTIMGEGAYYAPELTKVYERRGPEWMKVFIQDPQAMFPGERKMVKYGFTDSEIDDLIAFFKWIGEIDLNGFPAKPTLTLVINSPSVNSNKSDVAQPAKFQALCTACHSVSGKGGNVGPALDGVGKKYNSEYLHKWLSNPAEVKPGTAMPKLPLTEEELNELVKYLGQI
ncbi:MAG: c-type cytochrome [Leptospiraceae bacterium]|nr:c-type cytochrome [Leptospiraceae bacterium]